LANSVTAASKVSLEAATSVVAVVEAGVVVVVLAALVVAALVAADVVLTLVGAVAAAALVAAVLVFVVPEVAGARPLADCPSPSAAKAAIMAVTSELVLKPDWLSCPCSCSTGL
jgi:hypothetical protein